MKSYKTKILICVLNVMLILGLTNCANNTDTLDNKFSPLAVSLKDIGFIDTSNTKATRTLDNGYTTTFTNGDKIGLFIVDGSGNVTTRNLCLTYDGTNWNYPAGTMVYYDNTSTTKYFAYYPYQSTAPTISTTTTSASDFFSTAIANWGANLSTDQSTYAKYAAADLMVGAGSVGTLSSNATRPLMFSMNHQMGLVEINMPYYYLSTDANYKYIPGLAWTSFIPYNISGTTYHYIIKPSTSITISGKYAPLIAGGSFENFSQITNVAPGTYQTMNVDGGAVGTSHTLAVGDYYINDGSIIPNATTNKYLLDKTIGVIFSTSTSATDKEHGWTHGYAMALKNAATSVTWGALIDTPLANIQTTTSWTLLSSNKEGYAETQTIKNKYNLSDYPAFNAALNYPTTTPNNSSKWFLPSCGQWYDIFVNLGGMTATPTAWGNYSLVSTSWVRWSPGDGGSTDYGAIAATNINNYLSTLINYGYTVDKIINNSQNSSDKTVSYWCSSEIDNNQGFDAHLYNEAGVGDGNGMEMKSVVHPVRAVIAF
jgi:hypothetical protein